MSNLAQTPLDKPLMWMAPIWFNGGLVFISYFSHYCYMVYITTYIYIFSYNCLFIFCIIAEKKTKEPQKENISKKWNLTSPCICILMYVWMYIVCYTYIDCLEPALNREVHSMKWNEIILKFNSCKTLKSSCQKNVSLKNLEISQRFSMYINCFYILKIIS